MDLQCLTSVQKSRECLPGKLLIHVKISISISTVYICQYKVTVEIPKIQTHELWAIVYLVLLGRGG